MIRNVVMMKLVPGYDHARMQELVARLERLHCEGTLSYTVGWDLGARDGNWTLAIVADFKDLESYQAYDADAEHNAIRAELGPSLEAIARVQFSL
jgi:hypothetical protein